MSLPVKAPKILFDIGVESSNELFQRLRADTNGFRRVAEVLLDIAGIHLPLNDKNLCLAASRLSAVIKKRNLGGYDEYLELLNAAGGDAIDEFVSQMTTNTTHFFREKAHFEILSRGLPELARRARARGDNSLRIWCAAASSGQEPYTIAITAAEAAAAGLGCEVRILGTDIDRSMLEKAHRGVYTAAEIESLPSHHRVKYFDTVGKTGTYRVKSVLRNMLEWSEFNLTADSYPFHARFDAVFCRNVLIYFDRKTAQSVVQKLAESLVPQGFLFIGHSESGTVRIPGLVAAGPSFYQWGPRK